MKQWWLVLLAGGDGRRVQSLAIDHLGVRRPKQYFAFRGDTSPFRATLSRAKRLAPESRIFPIVQKEHEPFWEKDLAEISRNDILIQPFKRGTAVAALSALAHILACDPSAHVLMLPAGHWVQDEAAFSGAMLAAMEAVEADETHVHLLGAQPIGRELDHDWILVDRAQHGPLRDVVEYATAFDPGAALRCWAHGGLMSTLILLGSARAFADLYRHCLPAISGSVLFDLCAWRRSATPGQIATLYQELPGRDLSCDVLRPAPRLLRAFELPSCGWSDLGTDARVMRVFSPQPGIDRMVTGAEA